MGLVLAIRVERVFGVGVAGLSGQQDRAADGDRWDAEAFLGDRGELLPVDRVGDRFADVEVAERTVFRVEGQLSEGGAAGPLYDRPGPP